jgi:hypothetical protein
MLTTLYVAIGVMAIFLCALAGSYWLWVPWLISVFAGNNFFITVVDEGTGKWIIKGARKKGRAWRFITSDRSTDPSPDFANPEKSWDITETRQPKSARLKNAEGEESWFVDWIDRILPGGIRWVGLPFIYSIHKYNFRWDVLRQSRPGDGKDGSIREDGLVESTKLDNDKWVASFAKRLDYIYLRDAVYYFEVIDAEMKGVIKGGADKDKTTLVSMPVDIYMLATIRIVNPYRALFVVHDWLETTFDLIRPNVRSWVAATSYEDVVGKPEVAERNYDTFLKGTNVAAALVPAGVSAKSIGTYIEDTYGVREKRIAFDAVVPPAAYTTAAIERASAEQKKNTTITNAEADRDRQTIVAEGEANRIATVTAALAAGGDIALELRRLEALESVGEHGNMVVVSGKGAKMLINPGKDKKEK